MTPDLQSSHRGRPEEELQRKLKWITFGRMLVFGILLGAVAFITLTERDTLAAPLLVRLFTVAGAVYAVSIGYLVALRWRPGRTLRPLAYVQVLGDVAVVAWLVWLTGGYESIFSFLFSLAVINGAILLFRRGALVAAVLSSGAYALLIAGLQHGLIPPAAAWLAPVPLGTARLVYDLATNAGAFFLVGALTSHLAEQLRLTGQRLVEAEEDYAALAALHRDILGSVGSGILTLDGRGRITFLNRAGEELLGRRFSSLRGRPLAELLPALWTEVQAYPPAGGRPEVVLARGGEPLFLGFTVSALTPRGGQPGGRVVVFQDLTGYRRMEAAAQRNERLAALGALSAGLAHEIRNPLASMSGSVELLRGLLPPGADEQRLFDIVLREADRLNDLVTDFLQFARPAPPQLADVEADTLVRKAVESVALDPDLAGCAVEVAGAPDVRLRGDAAQLQQVLVNLLLNAGQALAGRGRVWVEVRQAGPEVCLTVADDGPGMPPDVVKHIFDPFFTTKERGSGLGLALAHSTVEAHGGRIEVVSGPAAGTRFTVVVPSAAPPLSRTGTD